MHEIFLWKNEENLQNTITRMQSKFDEDLELLKEQHWAKMLKEEINFSMDSLKVKSEG